MNVKNSWLALILCLIIMLPSSCEDVENELTSGKDYSLSSQAEVENFKVTENIRTLTIEGENITDLSNLQFRNVKNLIIENTGIENLSMPQLNAITVSISIRGNKKLIALNGLDNLKFVNGSFVIEDNDVLTDISGLLGLELFKGSLSVTDNAVLGENLPCVSNETGFCVIKYLLENSIISGTVTLVNNHPDAATDPLLIGQTSGSDIISYTLTSESDIDNFVPLSDTVANLTITGTDITDAGLGSLSSKIVWAKGTVTIENTGITSTEGFFDKVICNGSVILKNNSALTNPQGFKNYKKINGDLIIENCPNLFYWGSPDGNVGFSGISRVEGSLTINPATKMDAGGGGLGKLVYVGGDLTIIGDRTAGEIWNLDTWYVWSGGGIRHIGGNMVFKNHYKVNGLSGFQGLEYIGGDIQILDNGGPDGVIPVASTSNQIGFCIIKTMMNNGVLKKENPVIELRQSPGAPLIDISTLNPCE